MDEKEKKKKKKKKKDELLGDTTYLPCYTVP